MRDFYDTPYRSLCVSEVIYSELMHICINGIGLMLFLQLVYISFAAEWSWWCAACKRKNDRRQYQWIIYKLHPFPWKFRFNELMFLFLFSTFTSQTSHSYPLCLFVLFILSKNRETEIESNSMDSIEQIDALQFLAKIDSVFSSVQDIFCTLTNW